MPSERTFPAFFRHRSWCHTAPCQSPHSELLGHRQEMSGQQISAFALQKGDLPSHPSPAAAAQLHPCPPVPTVAREMLTDPRCEVFVHICVSTYVCVCVCSCMEVKDKKKGNVFAWVHGFVLHMCVCIVMEEKEEKEYRCVCAKSYSENQNCSIQTWNEVVSEWVSVTHHVPSWMVDKTLLSSLLGALPFDKMW